MSASVDESKGTWSYMAPELLHPRKFGLRNGRVSKQTDVYAFGIVVYEVLTGRPPYGAGVLRQAEIILRVMEGRRPSKPDKAGDICFGGGTWELARQCWDQDRDKRPTVKKILKHFRRAARTSMVVPPGPTTSVREAGYVAASEPNSSPGDFSQHLLHLCTLRQTSPRPIFPARLFSTPSQTSTSIAQQVKFAANLMTGGSIHSALSVTGVQLVHAKSSLSDRIGACIKGHGPLLRLGAPPSPP